MNASSMENLLYLKFHSFSCSNRLANALAKKPSTSVRDIEDTLTGPKVCCTLRIPTSYIIDTCIRVTIYFLWLH